MSPDDQSVWMLYGGGGRSARWRHVRPYAARVWFGRIPQRRTRQWYLDVWDHESNAPRSFALCDIRRVQSEDPR